MKYLNILLLILYFGAFGCSTPSKVTDQEGEGKILELADPTIFYRDGTYYLYGTGSNQGFQVYTSRDLKSWEGPAGANGGFALRKGESFGERGFWAPQVFEFNGKFYMAYTANESIAIAEGPGPLGPFRQKELKAFDAPVRQIDPFVFIDDDGTKYLYHVRVADGGNRIYVAELKDDFSGIKPETLKLCIDAEDQWENIENAKWSVIEGPTLVKHDNLYYLIYSANHFRSKDYAVGYAVGNSPYGPWEKYEGNPVIRRDKIGYAGAGHGDFIQGNNMSHYVFHTHASDTAIAPRKTAIVEAGFSKPKDGGKPQWGIKEKSFYFIRTK